jgi:hypothetical protein
MRSDAYISSPTALLGVIEVEERGSLRRATGRQKTNSAPSTDHRDGLTTLPHLRVKHARWQAVGSQSRGMSPPQDSLRSKTLADLALQPLHPPAP